MNEKIIVHIIPKEKFTMGYINFMHFSMNKFIHYFIVTDNELKIDINIKNDINFYLIQHKYEIIKDKFLRKILNRAEKIIVSGVFGYEKISVILPFSITNKMYLQFWGGDFYSYRECSKLGKKIKKVLMKRFIIRCRAVITLIEADYKELSNILTNKTRCFAAPMPADPEEYINYDFYRRKANKNKKSVRILVGNSASYENQHEEVFKILEKYKREDMEIICPLSYGHEGYRDDVIKKGKEIFQNKFIPFTEFLSKEEYVDFLSTCDIGIFNNNRQQGLGNIAIMIKLDKKIFIRDDTSMWKHFAKNSIKLNSINEIEQMDFQSFIHYDDKVYEENRRKKIAMDENYAINQWSVIFKD